jgi:putative addiction module CopG family antidote
MPRPLLTPADLPEEAACFAQEQIAAGRFANVDASIPAEMNALEERDATKLTALRAATDEGEASGVAEGNAFARVRAQQNGKAAGVLLSPGDLDQLSERAHFVAAASEGLADADAGLLRDHDEVVVRMRARPRTKRNG